MKKLAIATALLLAACGGSAPPPASSTPAASPPPPPVMTTAAAATTPTAAPTAPPPPVAMPDWVASAEDWANAVCACPTQACASAAGSKLQVPTTQNPAELQQWMPRYGAANVRGHDCAMKLRK